MSTSLPTVPTTNLGMIPPEVNSGRLANYWASLLSIGEELLREMWVFLPPSRAHLESFNPARMMASYFGIFGAPTLHFLVFSGL